MRFSPRGALPEAASLLPTWEVETREATPKDQRESWGKRRSTATIRAVLTALRKANGTPHCTYCQHDTAATLDHHRPISRFPGLAFDWDNLIASCDSCNRAKGDRYEGPEGELPIDPTSEDPLPHLRLLQRGQVATFDARGEWTCRLLRLERPQLRVLRSRAWAPRVALVLRYAELVNLERGEDAREVLEAYRDLPFASLSLLLEELVQDDDKGPLLLGLDWRRLRQAFAEHPELQLRPSVRSSGS